MPMLYIHVQIMFTTHTVTHIHTLKHPCKFTYTCKTTSRMYMHTTHHVHTQNMMVKQGAGFWACDIPVAPLVMDQIWRCNFNTIVQTNCTIIYINSSVTSGHQNTYMYMIWTAYTTYTLPRFQLDHKRKICVFHICLEVVSIALGNVFVPGFPMWHPDPFLQACLHCSGRYVQSGEGSNPKELQFPCEVEISQLHLAGVTAECS